MGENSKKIRKENEEINMSAPVRPPLKTKLDNDTSENRPVNTIAFANTDFTLTNSGTQTTVALSGGGGGSIGGSIADTQVAFGTAADTIGGSANFVFTQGSNQQLEINQTSTAGLSTIALKEAGTTAAIFQYRGSTNGTNPNTIRLGTNVAGGNLLFMTDSATANMYIDSTGKVGIGTTSPIAPLHVKDSGVADMLRLESTDTGLTTAPDLVLYRNAVGAAGDFIGTVDFKAQDSGGNEEYYARIITRILDASATHAGQMLFKVAKGGDIDVNNADIKVQAGTGIIFNEAGFSDMDFRVETDTKLFGFFVDAGANTVNMINDAMIVSDTLTHVNSNNDNYDFRVDGEYLDNLLKTDGSTGAVGIGTAPDSDVSLHVQDYASQDTVVRIESADSTSDAGPILELYRKDTGAMNKVVGKIEFFADNASDTKTRYAQIVNVIRDATAGGEDGSLDFYVETASNNVDYLRLGTASQHIHFNAGNNDIDFRYDTQATDNFFRIDSGLQIMGVNGGGSAGISDNNPVLQVQGSISNKVPIINTPSGTTTLTLATNQIQGQVLYFEDTGAITVNLPDCVTGDNIKIFKPSGNLTISTSGSNTINGALSVTRNSSATNALIEVIAVKNNTYIVDNPTR